MFLELGSKHGGKSACAERDHRDSSLLPHQILKLFLYSGTDIIGRARATQYDQVERVEPGGIGLKDTG
jgi:hypothetical protein